MDSKEGGLRALIVAALSAANQFFPWNATALVGVFVFTDWVLGTVLALRTGTWTFRQFAAGARKLALWGVILLVAAALRYPWGLTIDAGMKFFSDYLLLYVVLVELLSVLRNICALALMDGLNLPGLKAFVDALERWGDTGMARLRQAIVPPPEMAPEPVEEPKAP